MPSKKTSKVIDNESSKIIDNQEQTVIKKLSKANKSKKDEPVVIEPEKISIVTSESDTVKVPKSRKKVKETKVEITVDETITQTETKTKNKVKVENTLEPKSVDETIIQTETKTKKVKESKTKKEADIKSIDEIKDSNKDIILNVPKESSNQEDQIQNELEEVKTHWLFIVNKINDNDTEGKRLEIEKNKIMKKLKELLDKLQTDDSQIKGFLIDNKIQLTNTKNDIIPIKSDSESDSCDESSESDSEDIKPLLINKSSKTKSIIKTTKGSSKVPKLAINDSDSDSD